MTVLRTGIRYLAAYFVVVVCLTVMMMLVFLIPDGLIKTHQETSLYIVEEMENNLWFGNFFGRGESRLDQQTE